jgi:hypothetical protein
MKPMKSIVAAIAVALFASLGAVQAGPGSCCKKAQDGGKDCTHKCCVDAAKENKWCEKCGGSGEKPKKEKKEK